MSVSGLSVGIVGFPNVGKSTLFNAFLKRQIAAVGEYPYTTIEPNVGVVEVPDRRLSLIADSLSIEKKVPAAIEFIDIAGLIRGAHKGEGLGNQFLAKIREVDAILHVVRAFENPQVEHVHGKIDPIDDLEAVNEELKLADIKKPTIYILNVSEKDLIDESIHRFQRQITDEHKSEVLLVSAKLETEIGELMDEEQKQYLQEVGLEKSALEKIIKASYDLLNLTTFFTVAGGKQIQAWPIKIGSTIIEAAGMVHTDFVRGFITAEVVDFQKLVDAGSWQQAKSKGLIKTAGRDEAISDGQVVEFKFSL